MSRAAVGLIVLLAVALTLAQAFGYWRPSPPPVSTPSASEVEPWMADALPGVGPRTRQAATEALRQWNLQSLRSDTAAAARRYLRPPPEQSP